LEVNAIVDKVGSDRRPGIPVFSEAYEAGVARYSVETMTRPSSTPEISPAAMPWSFGKASA
jgi:hypothetical protein